MGVNGHQAIPGKNITLLLPLALLLVLRTCNNTDGNKLMIFFGIASYYGDNIYGAEVYTASSLQAHFTSSHMFTFSNVFLPLT